MAVTDVSITLKNGQFTPSKDPVPLSKGNGDTIKWHNDTNQNISISFDSGSPFPGNLNPYRIDAGQQKNSGNIQVQAGTSWDYSIRAASGAVADPQVIIQP